MATFKLDEDENNQTGGSDNQSLVQSTAPIASAPGVTGGGPTGKPTSSGQFQDVGKYLSAQTADQAKRGAESLAGQLNTQAQGAIDKVKKEAFDYSGTIKGPTDSTQGADFTNVDQGAFTNQLTGNYKAPDAFQAQHRGALNRLSGLAEGTAEQGGKVAALQALSGGPRMAAGNRMLTGALLNRPAGNKAIFDSMRQNVAQGSSGAVVQGDAAIQNALTNRQNVIAANQNKAKQWYDTQRSGMEAEIAQQSALTKSQQIDVLQAIANDEAKKRGVGSNVIMDQIRPDESQLGGVRDQATKSRIAALNTLAARSGLTGISGTRMGQNLDLTGIRDRIEGEIPTEVAPAYQWAPDPTAAEQQNKVGQLAIDTNGQSMPQGIPLIPYKPRTREEDEANVLNQGRVVT